LGQAVLYETAGVFHFLNTLHTLKFLYARNQLFIEVLAVGGKLGALCNDNNIFLTSTVDQSFCSEYTRLQQVSLSSYNSFISNLPYSIYSLCKQLRFFNFLFSRGLEARKD
jgi:hypothetical protein